MWQTDGGQTTIFRQHRLCYCLRVARVKMTRHTEYTETVTCRLVYWPVSRTTLISMHQNGKPFWVLLQLQMMGGGNGANWTLRYAKLQLDHYHKHINMFYRQNALLTAQQTAIKHCSNLWKIDVDCALAIDSLAVLHPGHELDISLYWQLAPS